MHVDGCMQAGVLGYAGLFVSAEANVICVLAGTSYGQLLHVNSGLGQARPSAGLDSLQDLEQAMPRE